MAEKQRRRRWIYDIKEEVSRSWFGKQTEAEETRKGLCPKTDARCLMKKKKDKVRFVHSMAGYTWTGHFAQELGTLLFLRETPLLPIPHYLFCTININSVTFL